MNSIANTTAGICFLLFAVLVMGLGLLEGQFVAGLVGAITMIVIAWAFFKKAERVGIEESINRRIFKGNFN